MVENISTPWTLWTIWGCFQTIFMQGKIQRSEQQLKQIEATSVKLKSCNLILRVPYLVTLISDYTMPREKHVFIGRLQRKQKLEKS